jgi:hypothetical protein
MERRKRQREEESYYDPLNRRRAGRDDRRGERDESYEEYNDPLRRKAAGRADRKGDRDEAYEEYADPVRRRSLGRSERAEERAEGRELYDEPYRRRGVARGDRAGDRAEDREIFDEPFRRGAVERGDRAGQRQETREVYDSQYDEARSDRRNESEELGLGAARRQNEYGEGDINQYRREESSAEFSRQADNATSIFDQTGNPQPLEDFYNDVYPDDGQVTIEKLPDGTYQADFGEGFGEPKTKEEVLAGSIEFFRNAPQMREENRGYGIGGYSGAGGRTRGGGRSGRGTTVKKSAWESKIDRTISDLVRHGDMSVSEATMEAHARAAQSSQTPPEEAIQKFYTTMVKELMGGMGDMSLLDDGEREEKMAQAEQLADTMTQKFADQYFGGGRPEAGMDRPVEEEGNDYLDSLLEDAL